MAVNIAYELDNRDGNEHRVIRITSKPLRYYRWEIESNDDESLHSKIDPEGNSFSTSNRTVVLHFEKNVLFVFFFLRTAQVFTKSMPLYTNTGSRQTRNR